MATVPQTSGAGGSGPAPVRVPTARWVSGLQQQGALLALVAISVSGILRYGANFSGAFNIKEAFLRNNTYYGLVALGMCFVIMMGGIDLSVGSVAALTAVVSARISGQGLWVTVAAAMVAGLAVGLFNGVIIAWFRVQPFIVTLATLLGARGAALVVSNNAPVSVDFSSGFIQIFQANTGSLPLIGTIPLPVLITILLYVGGSIMLNVTPFGRHILAIGGNEEAARLAGLPVARIKLIVYGLSGALAGLAGAFLSAQSYSGSPTGAVGWELTAIAAVVVGGTLLTGGVGSVGTTLVGVLLLGLIFNVLNFENGRGTFNLTDYWQSIIRGAFLLLVVMLQTRLTRRLPGLGH